MVVAPVAKDIHKEIPVIVRSVVDASTDWIDCNATEGIDGIRMVIKDGRRFLLLKLTLEAPFSLPSSRVSAGIRIWCASGNRLCVSGEADWSPTTRITPESPFEEHQDFRRVFVAPGLIDVKYAKAEIFAGRYLLFESPILQ